MLVWFSVALAGPPSPRCPTLALLPSAPPLRTEPLRAAATGGKESRDAFGLPNVFESENFAVRWGSAGGVTDDDAARLSAAAEQAWAVQIGVMGHPEPYGTDAYRFNVYVGDSGDGAPDGLEVSGYYYNDPAGWPMVVISALTLGYPDNVDVTVAHEFYHALQTATGRYPYVDPSAWYWEATASWAANETNPDNPANGDYIFGYLLLPQLSVNFFDDFSTGALPEFHQYGAYVFAYDLTRTVGWELVRDSWLDPTSERDPLEVQRTWLADRGFDFDELWLDHVAHNTVLDYPQGDLYAETLAWTGPLFPGYERVTATVDGAGGEGAVTGEDAPRRYGSSTIELAVPDGGTLHVEIDGDALGTLGSPARFGARIVRVFEQGERLEYVSVPFDGPHGALELEGVGGEDTIWLAVGAWTEVWDPALWHDETFDFRWELAVSLPPEPEPDPVDVDTAEPPLDEDPPAAEAASDGAEPAGCSCGTLAGAGGVIRLLAVVLWVIGTRFRPTACDPSRSRDI